MELPPDEPLLGGLFCGGTPPPVGLFPGPRLPLGPLPDGLFGPTPPLLDPSGGALGGGLGRAPKVSTVAGRRWWRWRQPGRNWNYT